MIVRHRLIMIGPNGIDRPIIANRKRKRISMAEDAFALSPIHARASLPTEADYDAICDAFMETARGRWFLGEYARRNRNADTKLVLDAVGRMEAALASQKSSERSLAMLLPVMRDAIAEARQRIIADLPKLDTKPQLEPVQRAAGLLRDVAWTLRESGAETRVCDLLDVQAKAIADGCVRIQGLASAANPAALVDEVMDGLAARITALAKTDDPTGAPAAASQPAPEVETTAAAGTEPSPAREEGPVVAAAEPPPQPVEAAAPRMTDAVAASPPPTSPAPVETKPAAPAVNLWDDLEIADTALARHEPAVAVTPPAPEPNAVFDAGSAPAVVPPEPAESAAEQRPATLPATETAAPASLGRAAMDSGAVATPAGSNQSEALAAIRRMSQAEKIAFFS